jgi:cytochrome c-type biogenesis protein CcmF
MKRLFLWPAVAGAAACTACLIGGIRSVYPLVSFTLSAFVVVTVLSEFFRAARARMRNTGENIVLAFGRIIAVNKRRYGGYIVHFGFVLLFVGFSGKAFTTGGWGEVNVGESFSVGRYQFECKSIEEMDDPNYIGLKAALAVSVDGRHLYDLYPEKRYYLASEQSTSEVRIHSTLREDVYAVFAGINEDDNRAVIEVFINPLVAWIWIGSLVMLFGTVVTILPSTREKQGRRQAKEIDRLLRTAESAAAR